MPVWGDAHRFAGEKRGFPASVLMLVSGNRRAGVPGGTGTGRPLSLLPILDTLQVMVVVAQGADGAAAGRQTLRRLQG